VLLELRTERNSSAAPPALVVSHVVSAAAAGSDTPVKDLEPFTANGITYLFELTGAELRVYAWDATADAFVAIQPALSDFTIIPETHDVLPVMTSGGAVLLIASDNGAMVTPMTIADGPEDPTLLDEVQAPPPTPPPPRTKWTRRVPHPVLIGHAASLTP
jgi:hypothetical protein